MRTFTFIALSTTTASVLASHVAPPQLAPRNVIHRGVGPNRFELLKRQNQTNPTSQSSQQQQQQLTSSAQQAQTSSTGLIDSLVNSLTTTQSTVSTQPTTSSVVTTSTPTTSSHSSAATTSSPSSKQATTSTTSSSQSGVTLTSTISNSSGTSSAASASSSADNSTPKSTGLSHATLISIIVVASCVAGVAAIWTIIRKTKFSPTKRFEARLEPIDFVPGRRDSFPGGAGASSSGSIHDQYGPGGVAHGRSPSAMSMSSAAQAGSYGTGGAYPASNLARSDSGGRSLRAAPVSEVSYLPGSIIPYNQASYSGQPYYNNAPSYGGGYGGDQYSSQYADLQRGASVLRAYNNASPYNYQAHGASNRY
ncbi:hypothetical protein T439DRAFT_360296 [Meredithblackwellia eburnea MCA 4105]